MPYVLLSMFAQRGCLGKGGDEIAHDPPCPRTPGSGTSVGLPASQEKSAPGRGKAAAGVEAVGGRQSRAFGQGSL